MKNIIILVLWVFALVTGNIMAQSSLTYSEPVVHPGKHDPDSTINSRHSKRPKVNKYGQEEHPVTNATPASDAVISTPGGKLSNTIPTSSHTPTPPLITDGASVRRNSRPVSDAQTSALMGQMAIHDNVIRAADFDNDLRKAEQGDSEAQRRTGIRYLYGSGVPRDAGLGREWLAKAANNENTEAQYNMGVLYRDGYGVQVNYPEAAYWFRKAARNGNANAQRSIGILFFEGKGVLQDYRIAAENFWRASEQGDVDAAYRLARMYEDGVGMPKDLSKAYEYFQRSLKKGEYKDASKHAEALKEYYKPQQTRRQKTGTARKR